MVGVSVGLLVLAAAGIAGWLSTPAIVETVAVVGAGLGMAAAWDLRNVERRIPPDEPAPTTVPDRHPMLLYAIVLAIATLVASPILGIVGALFVGAFGVAVFALGRRAAMRDISSRTGPPPGE
jgi:hypothetical protein